MRESERLLELPALIFAAQEVHGAEVGERVDERLFVVEAACELKRARSPGERAVGILAVCEHVRDVAISDREFVPGRQPLEQLDGFERHRLSFPSPADESQQS
jgi:hypothetical protein